jgi:hypothetical protein
MPVVQKKLLLRGTVRLSLLDANGYPTKWLSNGCQEDFGLTVTKDVGKHVQYCTKVPSVDAEWIKDRAVEIDWKTTDFSIFTAALAFDGKPIAAAVATPIVDELIVRSAVSFVAGDQLRIPHQGVTGLTLKDGSNAAIPVLSYSQDPVVTGLINVLAPFVGPIKASYSYSDPAGVALGTEQIKVFAVGFDGINAQAENAPVQFNAGRVSVSASGQFSPQGADIASVSFKGTCQPDPNTSDSGPLGNLATFIGAGLQ